MPSPGERLDRLREAIAVLPRPARRWAVHVRRAATTARSSARNDPPAVQQPRPPIFVGGKGDRLLALVAELGRRLEHVLGRGRPTRTASASTCSTRACERVGRDPATVWRSLGLYALCGEDERDLAAALRAPAGPTPARGARRRDPRPSGGRAAWSGTVEQVREQVGGLGRRSASRP